MDIKIFFVIFSSVFIAELGDKTQLATMLFAADGQTSKATVFFASAAALVLTSLLGVLLGGVISQYVSEQTLGKIAGSGFLLIGAWTLWGAFH